MRLILVRHGQTSSNVGLLLDTAAPGADLTEEGREQARALVEKLAPQSIDAIYASTLVRTQQTAAPLATARGLSIDVLDGLREIPAGDGEMGNDATDYITTLMKWHAGDLAARISGGEDAREFFARYDAAIEHIAGAGHGAAAAFSHGAALRVWASARIPGFAEALGQGHLANTGVVIADGDPASGWTFVEAYGFMHYNDEASVLDPAQESAG
jgi:broad specificity phosphatase PhoE